MVNGSEVWAIGMLSLHPLKNLYAIGDGGIVHCRDQAVLDKLLKSRNHGLKAGTSVILELQLPAR